MAEKISFSTQISGRVRLATESDVPHLHKLMYQMAKYHNYAKVFNATEASISTNLFKSNPCPPFYSKTINLDSPIVDPESELFRTNEDDIFIAGYILFFPSYSGYFEKPGFFIENMYVRECYRKYGFGKILFSAVASQAAKMGFSTVDWLTVGWNVDAIDFYLGMGAYIMADVKRFRLSGNGLDAFASSEDADKFR
uniref:Probable acetyltransferase NATA1-like n=1 Tax=Nicotiana tabacum TaxID=4097 RepID=A0A1S3ZIY5_TOBAC|nr:PREDICTED: probable acetyltransferase NATA1-like [Nicotiana tabacum]